MKDEICQEISCIYDNLYNMTEWTEERREKQRALAKRQVAEGIFGGAGRGQGRKRKPRHSEVVAKLVEKEGQTIFDRLMEILRDGTDSNSINAIKELKDYEERERKIDIEEEEHDVDNMRKDQLLALVTMRLLELEDKGVIPGVIEGEAVEVESDSASSNGAGTRSAIEANTS